MMHNRLKQFERTIRPGSTATSEEDRSFADHYAQPWVRYLERKVGAHPHTVLAAAVAVGIALGFLVKRR
jgi:ElaB/YqjD/DUF883 family membrane-anchored ribosome-binding protein